MKKISILILFAFWGSLLGQEFIEQDNIPELFVRIITPNTVFPDLERELETIYVYPKEVRVYKYGVDIELHNSVEVVEFDFIEFRVFTKEVGHNVPFFVGKFAAKQGDIVSVDDNKRRYRVHCHLSADIIDYYENKYGTTECDCLIKIHRVVIKKDKEGFRKRGKVNSDLIKV